MNLQENNISENNFEQCIKCTVCTVYCPVIPANPKYPGPKQAGPDGERFRLKAADYFDPSLKYCLNCKRCEVACPSGVRIGDIIQSARLKYNHEKPSVRDRMLADTDFAGEVATKMAPLVNATLGLKPVKLLLDGALAIDHRRAFPKYTSTTFEKWYRKELTAESQLKYAKRVAYFHGCYVNYNYPQLGKDLVKILNAVGYGVELLDDEKCCGVALIANGLYDQARRHARKNLDAMRRATASLKQYKVITTSSTCTLTMRDEYPHLLGIDNSDVRQNIETATRFIYRLSDNGEVRHAFRDDYIRLIAYHTPCHMEKLGWSVYSTSLMQMIPGVELQMLPSNCCGIAGTYGFKRENYQVSQTIGHDLFAAIEASGADFVATDCETCKWQIEMSTSKKVFNPISVIAEALDVEATRKLNHVKI